MADIEKVENIYKIMQFGVMSTPALVINHKVVLSGRLPSAIELKEILTKNAGKETGCFGAIAACC